MAQNVGHDDEGWLLLAAQALEVIQVEAKVLRVDRRSALR